MTYVRVSCVSIISMIFRYTPVEQTDDDAAEKLLGRPTDDFHLPSKLFQRPSWQRFCPWLIHGVLFCLYSVLFLALYTRTQSPETTQCVGLLSTYSPAYEAVEYKTVRFNGTLDFPSPYSGPPSPAVDAAWDRITTNNSLRPIRVADRVLDKIYKSGRASNVQYHEEDGGESMGTIEVFHQLHCLNMLRKYTYPDYYPELQDLWNTRPHFIRSHLDHCVEIIRQNLMCAADVGVITYDWLEGWDIPFPDFNTWHQCRNFDKILEWSIEHRVHIPKEHIRRLGHEVDLPGPPQ
ncbi:hypothetical protein AcV5_007676 [Taiwanofungus camphoratus]|nr:hypothetical protein AcV5_007676 [Antrodia cinnamomea]